jgi:hypothetical protein
MHLSQWWYTCELKHLFVIALLAAGATIGGAKKPSKINAPRVEVVELKAQRTPEHTIELDGRVRNCGDKPLRKLVLRFKVLDPDDRTLTTQNGAIDQDPLAAGEEAEFHWRMREHAGAVAVLVDAQARGEQLIVAQPGPYTIE